VQSGVREVNLIAQDTTYYGQDLGGVVNLTSLLRKLIRISDLQWIRILYGHPAHISDELLALMAEEERICSYIDLPIQHIHHEILKKMGRRTTRSQIRALIPKIRRIIPDVTLRTSLIVGFPGETEQQFKELMQFVEEAQFDHLGVFAYSAEEGTKAGDMSDQVPESVKEERLDRIAELHELIATKKRQRLIGQQKVVLVDRGGSQAIGRTQGQAPEIDDVVYITNGDGCERGEFVNLEIIDTCGTYDLMGRLI
jgi:ribosomal protein S12 methylthiotransferase